jgi:3-oxoacyl-[acyl-carrier protein] reductase
VPDDERDEKGETMVATAQAEAVHGRVALITGAGMGMGLATGQRLLEAGYRVVANDIDPAALSDAWGDAPADRVHQGVADVSDEDQVRSMVGAALNAFGRLDVLVNNAALHGSRWNGPCLSYDGAQWARLFDVNVLALMTMVRATLDALTDSRGVVVNMSSMVGYGNGAHGPYAVSKSAVNGLTTSLATELGPRGIRVVGVAPGFVATPFLLAGMDAAVRDRLLGSQATDVEGGPDDIAALIEFLVSPEARMITGHTVVADAGITSRP